MIKQILLWCFVLLLPVSVHALDLRDAYEAALKNDAALQVEIKTMEAEKAYLDQARGYRWPNLNFSSSYSKAEYERLDVRRDMLTLKPYYFTDWINEEYYQWAFTLQQPIYDRTVSKRILYAESRVAYYEARIKKAKQDLTKRVAEAYCKMLLARDDLNLAIAAEESYKAQWERLDESLKLGLANKMDMLEAKVRYDMAKADVLAKTDTLEAARLALEKITGLPVELAEVKAFPFGPFDAAGQRQLSAYFSQSVPPFETWLSLAVQFNLDIKLAQRNVDIADKQIDMAKAEHFPTLYAVGQVSDTDTIGSTIAGQDRRGYIKFDLPIFNGGRISAHVKETIYRKEAAQDSKRDTQRRVEIDVRNAWNQYTSLRKRVESLIDAQKSAELYLAAAEEGYNLKLKSLLDVLEARSRLFQIRRDLASAFYEDIIAAIQLKSLAGVSDVLLWPDRILDMTSAP